MKANDFNSPQTFGNVSHRTENDNNDASHPVGIKEFYKNASVLVTGGTGFLGKVLIEKLLRTCQDIQCIYVLIRSKRDINSEQRYVDLIKNPIFDRIRSINPNQLYKLVYVAGDIAEPLIGLSESNVKILTETVNIVLHSAATVKFDQRLEDAVNLNTLGSKRLYDLCEKMNKLKSIVHVSTAFTHPNREYVEEKVYPSNVQLDMDTFIKCANVLPADAVMSIALSLQGCHPNTYTLTKSLAERIVKDYHDRLPICIVRPSIVTAAIEEPFPGWIDNINSATGLMMEISRGTIMTAIGKMENVGDLIPVDIVCNTIIAAAWMNYTKPSKFIRVYNCTSGELNPIKWREYASSLLKYAKKNPTKYVMLYPNFALRTNRIIHAFYQIFYQLLPALIVDLFLRLKGTKPFLFKTAKKFIAGVELFNFFTLHEWRFETSNMQKLISEVSNTKDGAEFNCDVRVVNWDKYIETYLLGIRKYILKDGLESLGNARKRLRR